MLHVALLEHMRCVFIAIIIVFCPYILAMSYFVFILCISYNIIFFPLWDQYTDSIVPPPMCLFGAVSVHLSSQISQ